MMLKTGNKVAKIIRGGVIAASIIFLAGCASNPKAEDTNSANEPSFTRDYKYNFIRLYDVNNYIEGKYRSNFKNVPQDELLDSKEGFDYKVGTFTLDGAKLYVGWEKHILKDKDGKDYEFSTLKIEDDSGNTTYKFETNNEASNFKYSNWTGIGAVTQQTINGKDYVIAIAGRNSDIDGFRVWVEDSVPTDKADKATDQYGLTNYDWADVFEGVYKPGYIRLWGKAAPEYAGWFDMENCRTYKYNYNGVDFVIGFNKDCQKSVLTMDKKVMEPGSKTYFKIMYGDKGNRKMSQGYCFEGKVNIGDKSVTMAVILCNGDIRVFIKE